jgi:hypothetical protein
MSDGKEKGRAMTAADDLLSSIIELLHYAQEGVGEGYLHFAVPLRVSEFLLGASVVCRLDLQCFNTFNNNQRSFADIGFWLRSKWPALQNEAAGFCVRST